MNAYGSVAMVRRVGKDSMSSGEGNNQQGNGKPADDNTDRAEYDLIIVGGTVGGLSVAIATQEAGLSRVRIIEQGDAISFPELVPEHRLEVGYGEKLLSIDHDGEHVVVTTEQRTYVTAGCLVAELHRNPEYHVPADVTLSDKVTIDTLPDNLSDSDILVVGHTNHAAELVGRASSAGAGVVLAAGGMDPAQLAPVADTMLRKLERERRATLLYRAVPDGVGDKGEFPIAYFNDRRTPDLEFDHIVFASPRVRPSVAELGVTTAAIDSGKVWFLGYPEADVEVPHAHAWEIASQLAAACFPDLMLPESPTVVKRRVRHVSAVAELREEHYNATITEFEKRHSDLWVLRVRPDHGDTSHIPGQYASLGLGFWEDRVDDHVDPDLDERWHKLIRRSYSISHSVFESSGYFAPPDTEELEFYIVLVPADDDHVSALTPRLATKKVGDRIYLGPKVAGRYTLNAVDNPDAAVVFFATGTGEAPHNSMVVELLRKGHTGPIVSTVTVRNWKDLGYLDAHRALEERFPNYHYLPMPTRESDVPKRYLQDLIRDGDIEKALGGSFDPTNTHAFLCGNPAMIGLAEDETDADGNVTSVFPEPTGVIELLVERGFTVNKRNQPGNIHFEEYW